jgi:cysteine-rich repeat protein
MLPVCGNGVVEDGEVCDDSNTTDGDGCSATCTSDETCGNGVVDNAAGEVCDDGNTVDDGNGCSETCLSTLCGDGVVDTEVGEECDDGNTTDDGNGCSDICLRDNKDAFEADDDFDSATSIPIDGTVVIGHNLDIVTENVEDEDWYAIDIVDTVTFYEVVLSNTSCESGDQRTLQLTLYDTDGSSELRQEEEAEGESERLCPTIIWQFPAAGTYYVRVGARYGGRGGPDPIGAYDISVSASTFALDSAEPNDSSMDAARITVDGPAITDLNLLGGVDENDWFVFNVDSTTDLYDVRIDSPNLCVTGDKRSLEAALIDTDGSTEIDSRFEGGGTNLHFCPRWVTTFSSTGDHYLDVSYRLGEAGAVSEAFESYSVSVSKVVLEATEPDDDYLSATPLALSTPSTGHRLYSSSDEDWFSFVVTDTAGIYRIEVLGDECKKGDARNLSIELFDVDGTSDITSASEGEDEDDCAVIEYNFSEAGTYYVRLSGYWGGSWASGWQVPFENVGVQVSVLLP